MDVNRACKTPFLLHIFYLRYSEFTTRSRVFSSEESGTYSFMGVVTTYIRVLKKLNPIELGRLENTTLNTQLHGLEPIS